MFRDNPFIYYMEVPPVVQMTGKKLESTFWGDFRVCEDKEDAIRDTFNRSFECYKDDKEYGTELSLVLNWLCWFYYDHKLYDLSAIYQKLWEKLDRYIMSNWKGDDLNYYLKETD